MDMTPVVSSNIASVGYNTVQNILYVQFKGKDTVYEYHGVPLETYEAMMSAESIGSYYAKNIRNVIKGQVVEAKDNAREGKL